MEIPIIYQNEDFIVINKPPGISVHGGDTVSGLTVVDFLLEKFPEIKTVGDEPEIRPAPQGEARSFLKNERPGIVHRLDKDTSGVMVVARMQESFEILKDIFKNRLAEKTYYAIVCGKVSPEKGVISFSIGRLVANPLKRGVEQGSRKIRGARDAVTEYKVLKAGEKYSLLEVFPKTGRMHQIRVHLSALHRPIACDTVYGGKKVCCPAGCGRQLLHARSLSFVYSDGQRFSFEADYPKDFSLALKSVL